MKNKNCYLYWVYLFIVIIGFVFFYYLFFGSFSAFGLKEGFTWSKESIRDFLIFQSTVNPNTQFDMEMIQKQASEDELRELLNNGRWPWSENTKYLYMDAVNRNKILKVDPQDSLDFVQKLYNENAGKKLLSWNTKEGQFLLNGVKIDGGSIQCGIKGSDINNDSRMVKKVQKGYNLWNGYRNLEKRVLKDEELENEIQGFHFIQGPCNPCVALNDDYFCPFQINVQGEHSNHVSPIWKELWNL